MYYAGSRQGKVTRSISITSGKGGVGKTTLSCNIAYQLGESGKKVLLFDGDVGMANADIMFGVRPQFNIFDVLKGDVALSQILIQVAPNVFLIPGGSGIRELQNINPFERRAILDEVGRLDRSFDYLLIDTAPGISDNVLALNSAAQTVSVIITPEPASFADSYALIKILNKTHKVKRFAIICNQVEDEQDGLLMYKRFNDVVMRFLDVGLDYFGTVPMDQRLRRATYDQRLIVKQNPNTPASQGICNLVANIEHLTDATELKGGIEFFWEQMVGVA